MTQDMLRNFFLGFIKIHILHHAGEAPVYGVALIAELRRHGYELSKLIESRSGGVVRVHAASLYPLLYELEAKRWIEGRWVEKAGERRRRFYQLTPAGRRQLATERRGWLEFANAVSQIAGVQYA